MTVGAVDLRVATRPEDRQEPSAERPRRIGFGAMRALAVLPAVCGGLLVAMALTAGLGHLGALLFLAWMSVAGVLCTAWGEHLAVRRMCRFRTPTEQEQQLLGPVAMKAMVRCGLQPGTIDWYLQAGSATNACAAGRRSVAVTDGALESFVSGRLPADQLMAVLVHEIGHHQTRAARYALATTWLAAPGRIAFRFVVRISMAMCGGHRQGPLQILLELFGAGFAAVQLEQNGQWLGLVMLLGLVFALVGTPLVDGAVSRASEHAADAYAHAVGVGPELAQALLSSHGGSPARRTTRDRLLDRHPSVTRRVERLQRPAEHLMNRPGQQR